MRKFGNGIIYVGTIEIVIIIFRLFRVVNCSWWLCLLPIIATISLYGIYYAWFGIVALIGYFNLKRKK